MNSLRTYAIAPNGHLQIGGCDAVELAASFGTPLYVLDGAYIRAMCDFFVRTLDHIYPGPSLACYASKALSTTALYTLVSQHGMGADVVSLGELATALRSSMPPQHIYFHGNNKSRAELEAACVSGIGAVVVDSVCEIALLATIASKCGVRQRVLLRCNPSVQTDTFAAVQTANPDSKFGFAIDNGQAQSAVEQICAQPSLEYVGLHCHIGSQLFDPAPYASATAKMCELVMRLHAKGIITTQLNMGGGFGVDYMTDTDDCVAAESVLCAIADTVTKSLSGMELPSLVIEPGRSIVAKAGYTLYTVGAMRHNVRDYIAVDGGMFDSPRYALYKARYQVLAAAYPSKPGERRATIVGKCCESGDIIAKDVPLCDVSVGDVLAVLYTGAYNYSMASNYNRNLVPPVVLVDHGIPNCIVRPQTIDDLLARDIDIQ